MADTYSGINLLIVREPANDEIKYYPHYYDSGMKDFPFLVKEPSVVIADFKNVNTLEDRELISAWCNLASAKSSLSSEEAEAELISNLERKFNEKNDKQ